MSKNNSTGLFAVALISAVVGAGAYHLYATKLVGKVAGLTSTSATPLADDTSAVVVTVNGTTITQDQIDRRTTVVAERAGEVFGQLPPAEKARVIKENLILETLVDQQMKDSGIDADPAVARELAEARQQVLRTAYLDKIADAAVTDDALRQMYDTQVAKIPDETEIHARHILVKDEAVAKEIIAKIKAGMKFEDLAKEFSEDKGNADQGGDLGFFTKDQMVPEFAAAAFALQAGEVSATPVKTGFGYHVVEVLESRAKAKPSFEEVKTALEGQERNRVIKDTIQKWRKEAKVEGDVEAPAPVAPAPVVEEVVPQETPAPAGTDAPTTELPAATAPEAPAADAPVSETETTPVPTPATLPEVSTETPAVEVQAPVVTEEVQP